MKHNHTTRRVPTSGTSPYVRHAKREYQYSEPFMAFKRATDQRSKGSSEAVRDAAARHDKAWGIDRAKAWGIKRRDNYFAFGG